MTTSQPGEPLVHYTPEEHDLPACDAEGDGPMLGTLNTKQVTCPECLATFTDDDHAWCL